MEVENDENGQDGLPLVNRLSESRSPYVSPHCVASRPTMKDIKLRGFSCRSGDT